MKIDINIMSDIHECETCGSSWSEGGTVYVDDELILERLPSAYCYDSPSFNESDLLVMALKKIGIHVMVDGEPYQICAHDDEYHGHKLVDNT
jgi:hypothetical protein